MKSELDKAFSYIESFANFERRSGEVREFKLERVHRLCTLFGNPQDDLRIIHIAGSKGKGSTAFYLASILSEAGFKTGLYTSPHLVSYTERISLAGTPWPDDVYVSAIRYMRERLEGSDDGRSLLDELSTFELLTVLGFIIFKRMGCEWAVVETGMGGRLDATNVVKPVGCVITHIELEHTRFLGDTLEKIAGEKAGIIKPGRPVIVVEQRPEVMAVLEERARSVGSDFLRLSSSDKSAFAFFEYSVGDSCVSFSARWQDGKEMRCNLDSLLDVMAENAALAASAASFFAGVDSSVIVRALGSVKLPGRLQRVSSFPAVYVDGSHTPDSVAGVARAVERAYGRSCCVVIFACAADKDAAAMLRALSFVSWRFVITRAGSFKPSFPERVFELAVSMGLDAELCPLEEDALNRAIELAGRDGLVLATGSFYLAGEFIRLLS